jgi:flagellar basal-body rod protein FlgG
MIRTLDIGASGMEAQQIRTDNIANNMANVSTNGFKKGVVAFQDMLYNTITAPGANSAKTNLPVGIQLGTGVMLQSVNKDFSQGDLISTGNDLDLAIEGAGFFQITMPDGSTTYTRTGNFHMDSTGKVVTAEGYDVLGFPTLDTNATSITITADGTVTVYVNGQSTEKGRIQLARIPSPDGLNYLGHNLYQITEASGNAVTGNPGDDNFGNLVQYYQEGSNVEIVGEMVSLISSQRAYEMNSKSVKAAEDMLRIIAGLYA